VVVSAHDQPTDAVLVARVRDGSTDALGSIYERYAAMLYRLAVRLLGAVDDAEDLVQDLFVGLPEALRRYEERGRLEAWLRLVATRMALMLLRARRWTTESPVGLSAPGQSEDRLATRITLERAIAQLSDPLRVVFVLKEVEGYSHAEIAKLLGIRPGTSEVRLHRAIRTLRATLGSA
jgi:RNA polymerase sigma-70 factor (ECF subfamily)